MLKLILILAVHACDDVVWEDLGLKATAVAAGRYEPGIIAIAVDQPLKRYVDSSWREVEGQYFEKLVDQDGEHISYEWEKIQMTARGAPAVVGEESLFMFAKGKWREMTGCFTDVAFGRSGEIMALGCETNRQGNEILMYKPGKGWVTVPGGGISLSIDKHGNPWIVNKKGYVFRWSRGAETWRFRGGGNFRKIVALSSKLVFGLSETSDENGMVIR
jgi:hypothetical protein